MRSQNIQALALVVFRLIFEYTDGFEIKRRGDTNIRCKLIVYLDNQPERYKVAPLLTEALGIIEDTKANVISSLWMYVKV